MHVSIRLFSKIDVIEEYSSYIQTIEEQAEQAKIGVIKEYLYVDNMELCIVFFYYFKSLKNIHILIKVTFFQNKANLIAF